VTDRIKGAAYLADYPAAKVIVACDDCGFRVQYDKLAMLKAGGDRPLTTLLTDIANRHGCKQPKLDRYNAWKHCKARYENVIRYAAKSCR
jgi:hypothetical protein